MFGVDRSESRAHCGVLLVFIILQHITITAERDLIKSYKNTAEEFNKTINSLQNNFSSLSQKNLELEINVTSLSEELKKESTKRGWFFMSDEVKNWSDSRQYCRDHGADLVIINSEEKQSLLVDPSDQRFWRSSASHRTTVTYVTNVLFPWLQTARGHTSPALLTGICSNDLPSGRPIGTPCVRNSLLRQGFRDCHAAFVTLT
ncbi:hypothetical protein QQF64_000048 [Cirrhinus molitorella]|uniref:C-type lectin domain-containing protein n=1 Tax=Cirrhinus molitorella TaxID=172907 RepID=A0ABR3NXM3_9TELE